MIKYLVTPWKGKLAGKMRTIKHDDVIKYLNLPIGECQYNKKGWEAEHAIAARALAAVPREQMQEVTLSDKEAHEYFGVPYEDKPKMAKRGRR